MGYSDEVCEQAVKMVIDGTNFRRVGRFLRVNHQSVVNWYKAAAMKVNPAQSPRPKVEESDIVELDELFTFVGSKKTKCTS